MSGEVPKKPTEEDYKNLDVYREEMLNQVDEREALAKEDAEREAERESARAQMEKDREEWARLMKKRNDTLGEAIQGGAGIDFNENGEDYFAFTEEQKEQARAEMNTELNRRRDEKLRKNAGNEALNRAQILEEEENPNWVAPAESGERAQLEKTEIEKGVQATTETKNETTEPKQPENLAHLSALFREIASQEQLIERMKAIGAPEKEIETVIARLKELEALRDSHDVDAEKVKALLGAEKMPISFETATALRRAYEAKKDDGEKRSGWQWFKERLKGYRSFGLTEFHQAERFRSNTKEVGKDVEGEAKVLHQTEDLDIDVAHEEANRIRAMAQTDDGEMTKEGIQVASDLIDSEKKAFNEAVIKRIVSKAREDVVKRLAKYKDQFGEGVLGKNRLAEFEADLRIALEKSTIGREEREKGVEKKKIEFAKVIRERLDPKYWKRYVYGGISAAVDIAVVGSVITKLFAEAGVSAVKAGAGADRLFDTTTATPNGAENILSQIFSGDIPMKDSIWDTTKQWLIDNGVPNPSNQMVQEFSENVAIDNGISVKAWGIPGEIADTAMKEGHVLNYAGSAKILAQITGAVL